MPDSPPASSPVVIPDHELLRVIGRGSYGEVWLARDVLGELRAVKLVRHSGAVEAGPSGREFDGLRKFEPVSRSHPGLVHILHAGRFEGGFFYVMELADPAKPGSFQFSVSSVQPEKAPELKTGNFKLETYSPRTLRSDLQTRGRLPVTECVKLALRLTEALAHLHGHGLVHRDIKPSNIIFVRGQPKLADIGLVASADASMSCVGTEGYLPPEGPGKPPADLYALGKVLYELATGRDRTDFPELPTLLREDPERGRLEEFNEVILKACEPEARRRYQSAKEMRADLELIQAGKSLQQVHRRARCWVRSRNLALAAGIVVTLVAGALWLAPKGPPAPRPQPAVQSSAQLPVFNPLNGHWYQAVPGVLTWDNAARTAQSRGGHLATITSFGEQVFIAGNFPEACNVGYWLGARQEPGQTNPAAAWSWVTGENWDYTHWLPGAEPGNPEAGGADEDRLALHGYMGVNPEGFWNDVQGRNAPGFVCEWETATTLQGTPFVGRLPLPPSLTFQSATSSNPDLVNNDNISVSKTPLPGFVLAAGSSSTGNPSLSSSDTVTHKADVYRVVEVIPENDKSGSTVISCFFVHPGGGAISRNFTLMVRPADAPSK